MPPDFNHDYPLAPEQASGLADAAVRPGVAAALWELTKPRLSFLSVVTALVGYLAARPERDHWLFLTLIAGTGLAAGGAAALNQWMERRTDALMRRTKDRPVPAGVIAPGTALIWGLALTTAGLVTLLTGVNGLAAALCALTVVSYLAIYTPMKQRTRWATEIGAVSGALPPLVGWAAARGGIDPMGWLLFAVLFLWQIPHFMAIAWTYRNDYAAAHFPMLSVGDEDGSRTATWSLINTVALAVAAVAPSLLGFTSWYYGGASLLLAAVFIGLTVQMLRAEERDGIARRVFFYSIIYLPALLGALVLDRWLI